MANSSKGGDAKPRALGETSRAAGYRKRIEDIVGMAIILPIAGFVIGAACQLASMALAGYLLKSRSRSFEASARERWITCALMGCFGAAIGCFATSVPVALYLFLLLVVAGAATLIDVHERIIPNELVLAIIGLKLAFGIPALLGAVEFPAFNVLESCIACALCLVLFMLPRLVGGVIGLGDVKLAAAMGFCLGLSNSLVAVALMGAFVLVYTVAQKSAPTIAFLKHLIPMGPFLATAMMVVLLVDVSPASIF